MSREGTLLFTTEMSQLVGTVAFLHNSIKSVNYQTNGTTGSITPHWLCYCCLFENFHRCITLKPNNERVVRTCSHVSTQLCKHNNIDSRGKTHLLSAFSCCLQQAWFKPVDLNSEAASMLPWSLLIIQRARIFPYWQAFTPHRGHTVCTLCFNQHYSKQWVIS